MFEHHWRRRHRHGKVGRPPKPVVIKPIPLPEKFEPVPRKSKEPIYLEPTEVEALRLIELEKLSFEEASVKMKVSRNTVWRLTEGAREKVARAIVESREIYIQQE